MQRRQVEPTTVGRVMVSVHQAQEQELRNALDALGLNWQVIANRKQVMALPAGVDKAIVAKLNQELVRILQLRETRELLTGTGMSVVAGTPEQFAQTIRDDQAKFARIIKSAGIRVE